jgi:thiamine pyrophosphate-dependent acetolactate synthase large subunit-like protein
VVKNVKLSGAEAVAKALEKCGVQRFFYMMGGMPLYGTIENEGVKTVLCRNE